MEVTKANMVKRKLCYTEIVIREYYIEEVLLYWILYWRNWEARVCMRVLSTLASWSNENKSCMKSLYESFLSNLTLVWPFVPASSDEHRGEGGGIIIYSGSARLMSFEISYSSRTVAAIEAKIFDQFICLSSAVHLINAPHESSNFEKFVKTFTASCLLTILTNHKAKE